MSLVVMVSRNYTLVVNLGLRSAALPYTDEGGKKHRELIVAWDCGGQRRSRNTAYTAKGGTKAAETSRLNQSSSTTKSHRFTKE